MRNVTAAALLAIALFLGGCGGYDDAISPTNTTAGNGNPGGTTPPPQPGAATALFNPSTGQLPYPTDLYFAGSTDGTLNIQPPNALEPNQAAVNALDGYSTTAVIRENFSTPLNPATFTPASVIIVPVVTDNTTKATIGVLGAPLTMGVDFTAALATDAGVGNTILEITPLHPLMPSTCISNTGQFLGANCKTGTGYLVFLTNGIADATGNAAQPDSAYAAIKTALAAGGPTCPGITNATLNGICQLTGAHLAIAGALAQQIPPLAQSLNPANIVLSFSFTTESTTDTLVLMSATAMAQTIKLNPTPINTSMVNPLLPGHANIWVGVVQVPYYLSKGAPLTGSWNAPPFPLDPTSTFVTRYNPLPVPTQNLLIPVLVTVPNAQSAVGATPPAGGWPVLVFQHGITRSREDMFGVADSFADHGFVVVAIDLPLHGVTSPEDPFYATDANPLYTGLIPAGTGSIERTFDLSVISPPAVDPSGSHFINLTSVLTSRDNLREGVADLVTFARSLPGMTIGAAGVNPSGIHYLGHSLGAIEGTSFMAVVNATGSGPVINTATLASPGGVLTTLLENSPTFAPVINAGLEAQGLQPGTTLYAQFFRDAQTAIDAGDPVNFVGLATAQHPIHLMQVVGGGPDAASPNGMSPPDQVVPNSATQALIAASAYGPAGAGGTLTRIASPPGTPPIPLIGPAGGFHAYVNFVLGDHGSIIDGVVPPVTFEMQGEAISFALSNGAEIVVNVPQAIQP
jgi:pimeloyl-ACP methyl ester carboxylesterase